MEVFRENCTAAKIVAELFSSALGPMGGFKVLLEESGDFKLSKDGGVIFGEVASVHPVAKLLTAAGRAVKAETGDGAFSTVVLAGLLIERAWNLVSQGIHPTLVAEGYHKALQKTLSLISQYSITVSLNDRDRLIDVARTHLNTKVPLSTASFLAPMVVDSLIGTAGHGYGAARVNAELVKVEGRRGGSVKDSMLINGVILHKKAVDRGMPRRVYGARIAFFDCMLGIERPDMFTKVYLSAPEQMKEFYRRRFELFQDFLNALLYAGANVVLSRKEISEELRRLLAYNGILAVRNVPAKDMHLLRWATKGSLVSSPTELHSDSLGECELVEEEVMAAQDRWLYFRGCKDPNVRSILIRGVDDYQVEETKRAVVNCLKTLQISLERGGLLPGGGTVENSIAASLRKWSLEFPSKLQLVVQAYATALQDMPLLLAKNAGRDITEARADLLERLAHGSIVGIDAYSGVVVNTVEKGILEPTEVKAQYIKSATEVAITVIRVDYRLTQPQKPPAKKSPIPEPVRLLRERSGRPW